MRGEAAFICVQPACQELVRARILLPGSHFHGHEGTVLPSSAFGSAVVCTHVFLEGKMSFLPVVLNRTLNSSLKGSKSPDKRAFKSSPPILEIQMQLGWNRSVPVSVSSAFRQLLQVQFQVLFSAA